MLRELALFASICLAGCASGPRVHLLSNAQYGETITLEPGEVLEIQVYANASTGYEWTREGQLSGALVEIESRLESLGRAGEVGAGAVLTLRLRAEQPGQEVLRYVYRRPWETGTPPDDRVDVVVQVK